MGVLKVLLAGLFKSLAFAGAVAIIVALLISDSPHLVAGLDMNLRGMKWVAAQLPQGFGNRTETLLRLWNIERAMLFAELMAVVELALLGLGRLFRLVRFL